MSNGHAQRLRLRLFLEGVEVPVISAQVQAAPNRPAMAALQVPPLAEATRLHPRTLVHLFFLDMYTAASPFIDAAIPQDSTEVNDPTTANKESGKDSLNRNYKLLFVGEVVGYNWTKNARQRAVVLQCADLSNYWDYAYQWENTGLFGPGFKAVFSGGATNLFTDFLSTKGSVLTSIVASGRCNTFPQMQGLAAGIVRLIEAIGGTYFPRPGSKARAVRGQNLFFSMAELRLRITQMVAAVENDPTSKRLLVRHGYSGMFDRALGGMGKQTSIRDAINAMTKIVFHETYPQPCPYYLPGKDGTVSGTKIVDVKDHPVWGFIVDRAERSIAGLRSVSASLASLSEEAELLERSGVGTRSTVADLQRKLLNIRRDLYQTLTRMRGSATNPPPSQAQAIFTKAAHRVSLAQTYLGSWRPRAPDGIKQRPYKAIDEAILELDKAVKLRTSEVASSQIEPARLVQQILRPDIWFGAPPRCNVLFPEAYDTIDYKRQFLQEPTRFLLKTNDEFFGEDALFDRYYFAPQAGNVRGDKTRMQDMMRGALLDHELFTGILPIFEKMGEFNVFANRSGTVTAKGGVAKAGPAQRSANFLYFKHRFSARYTQIQGKFNPYVAVGFPGLVIDRYVDIETIKLHNELRLRKDDLNLTEEDLGKVLGTNFLGNFTQVTHIVSQEEKRGVTVIQAGYSRQPEEGVEFLGVSADNQKLKTRQSEDALRTTDIASLNPPRVFSVGPNFGRITHVQEVTESYLRGSQEGRKLPFFDIQAEPVKKTQKPTLVPINYFASEAREFGSDIVSLVGDPTRLVRFKAYRITEEVPQYRQDSENVPIEEFIRPGWYGDLWTNSKIGQIYNDFFGTGAITDEQVVTGPAGKGKGVANEQGIQASEEWADADAFDDPKKDALGAYALEQGSTIKAAVEFLWLIYSYIKQEGLDVEEFIRTYTWRPIATMVDMFGTEDLKYSSDGQAVLQGVEGFHSKAFGNYDDLFGLVGPEVEDILGIKRGSQAAQKADTRKQKLQRVKEYISAIAFNTALLG